LGPSLHDHCASSQKLLLADPDAVAAVFAQAAADTGVGLNKGRKDPAHLLNLFGREGAFWYWPGGQLDRAHCNGTITSRVALVEAELAVAFAAMRQAGCGVHDGQADHSPPLLRQ
jgi:hypothetical protein